MKTTIEVTQKKAQAKPFRLRKASFKGDGLNPGMEDLSWDKLRARIPAGVIEPDEIDNAINEGRP